MHKVSWFSFREVEIYNINPFAKLIFSYDNIDPIFLILLIYYCFPFESFFISNIWELREKRESPESSTKLSSVVCDDMSWTESSLSMYIISKYIKLHLLIQIFVTSTSGKWSYTLFALSNLNLSNNVIRSSIFVFFISNIVTTLSMYLRHTLGKYRLVLSITQDIPKFMDWILWEMENKHLTISKEKHFSNS